MVVPICVKTFLKMKFVKSLYKYVLTYGHLQSMLMTGNTNSELQLSKNVIPKRIIIFISRLTLQKTVLNYNYLKFHQ